MISLIFMTTNAFVVIVGVHWTATFQKVTVFHFVRGDDFVPQILSHPPTIPTCTAGGVKSENKFD